jgi:hypothetical protein
LSVLVEPLRRADYEMRPTSLAVAQEQVARLHYAGGGSNACIYVHGIFERESDRCLGTAWWLHPTPGAAKATYDGDWKRVLALTRFVLEPELPPNAATFLLARAVKAIRRDGKYDCLVTYADEAVGHHGGIYRAAGWEYLGLTKPQPRWIDPATGRQVARKASRTRDNAEMRALGYVQDGSYRKHKFRKVLR